MEIEMEAQPAQSQRVNMYCESERPCSIRSFACLLRTKKEFNGDGHLRRDCALSQIYCADKSVRTLRSLELRELLSVLSLSLSLC